jgi:putative ABC transport system ATP-binding protein
MLEMKNITVRNVLKNLNLTVNKNEFVLIVGENGAGKTTLFNTISGYTKPKSGKIMIDNIEVTSMPQYSRASFISNVFQDPKLGTIGEMTIRENLNMSYMRGKSRKFAMSSSRDRDSLYVEKLKILNMNLENRLNDRVENLSGGQRQALSIIMSIIADSKLLLLDEITAALDHKSSENILGVIDKTIRREKITCIMITHNLKHLGKFGDKIFILQNGNLKSATAGHHNVL